MSTPAVLVVEDEHIVALDIRMHLEKYGYRVPAMYPSGEEALEKIADVAPDLVLMDIKLQGEMDGVEAAQQIKDEHNIPVILLTAYADEATIQRAKLTQPFAYIIKPFEERELRTAIEIALYRHRMERELEQRERLFQTTLNSIGDAVVVTDTEDRIEFANRTAVDLFGFDTQNDLVGRQLSEVVRIETETDEHGAERTYAVPAGAARIPVEYRVTPLQWDSGIEGGSVSVYTNISSRLRAEEALHASEEQLRHAQKMEAVGRLSGGIAHDFNNLLTVILGYSKLVLGELRQRSDLDGNDLVPNIEGIQKAAVKSVSLTRQLLAFSRRQVLEPKYEDLNDIVSDMEKMLRRLLTERVNLQLSLNASPATVYVDRGQVEQVLMNLAVNARDAMPSGGSLLIKTEVEDIVEPRTGSTDEIDVGRYIVLRVKDTGVGIDRENIERVFEPFFTTKERGAGTGLGLSTVYGIVKQTGGSINIESEQGRGTTFVIHIPHKEGDRSHTESEAIQTPMAEYGSETILVVEDDESIRDLICTALKQRGYQIIDTANAGEALLVCEENHRVDLLISDIVMPHVSGTALAKRIRTVRPGLRVLLISAYPDQQFDELGELEDVEFLPKPFDLDTFLRTVRAVLDSAESE
jgi:PAS domain S-box-containing protein